MEMPIQKEALSSVKFPGLNSPFNMTGVSSPPPMQVHRSTENLPPFDNAVITIGTFDGVHLGHQKIIAALKQEAQEVAGESIVITFHPHPRKIVQPHKHLQLINTLDEKIALLRHTGINHLLVIPFTPHFPNNPPMTTLKTF